MITHDSFLEALSFPGRSPEIPESDDVYGWLVGAWELDVCHYKAVNVAPLRIRCEAHFAWVLEGRAVQDVWIMPRRSDRAADTDKINNMYGTTLRVWDPSLRAWRIDWINPVTGHREQQIGRWSGKDVLQEGVRADGSRTRWMFTEIEAGSFHWTGESQKPGSGIWKLEGEFRARRMSPMHDTIGAMARAPEKSQSSGGYLDERNSWRQGNPK